MADTLLPRLRLYVETGPHAGMTCESAGETVLVGRDVECDLRLGDDHTVSGQHARFYLEGGQWFVSDCGSRNGIFVPGTAGLQRLTAPMAIEGDNSIHLGASQIAVHILAAAPATIQREVAPDPPGLTLQIRYDSGSIRFVFGGSTPISTCYAKPYSTHLVEGLVARLNAVIQLANLDGEHAARAALELRDIGERLTRELVPERVLEKLAELGPCMLTLAHDSELMHIPWECCRLGNKAWCECLDLGRQTVLDHVSVSFPNLGGVRRPSLLLAVNPTGDLDSAQEESERLLRQLGVREAWIDIVLLAGNRVTLERLLAEMEEATLVYYIGHGHFDPVSPERSGWRLSDGALTAAHMRNLRCPPRVVISNACDSARETTQTKCGHGCAENLGMASKFLFAGVEAFVGALWPVAVAPAAVFGQAFLHHALSGEMLGPALRRARLELRDADRGGDLAWSSYILYGDPQLRVGPGVPL